MKTRNICKGIALMAVALTTAACQNEINEDTNQPKPGEKVTMTIHATQGNAPQTRTSYDDQLDAADIDKVVVKWLGTTKEKIDVYGYTQEDQTFSDSRYAPFESDPTTLSTNGSSIDFTGTAPIGTHLVAIYPAGKGNIDEGNLVFNFEGQEQDCTRGSEMAHLQDYDIMLGTPVGTSSTNYSFTHKAIMLRFNIQLPQAQIEQITGITLATDVEGIMSANMYAMLSGTDVTFDGYYDAKSLSLAIKNHTKANTLKAYMMTSDFDFAEAATLTVTVNTASGNTYTGDLDVAAGTTLTPGMCYTLAPTLTLSKTISLPTITAGGLSDVLDNVNPETSQTELVLKGKINSTDIDELNFFLAWGDKSASITTLDLSGLTYLDGVTDTHEVTGLKDCEKLVNVILPDNATAIGDEAFQDCKALISVTQNDINIDESAFTRASMPSGVKKIGARAFKNCTSMTEMFLHAGITSVGTEAFKGCLNLKALVFEGDKTVGNGITLGTGIVNECSDDIVILLPNIKTADAAKLYKTALGKPTYYNFPEYGNAATPEDKVNTGSYTKLTDSDGGSVGDLDAGGDWGSDNTTP